MDFEQVSLVFPCSLAPFLQSFDASRDFLEPLTLPKKGDPWLELGIELPTGGDPRKEEIEKRIYLKKTPLLREVLSRWGGCQEGWLGLVAVGS